MILVSDLLHLPFRRCSVEYQEGSQSGHPRGVDDMMPKGDLVISVWLSKDFSELAQDTLGDGI